MKQTPAQRARAPDEILRSRKTEKPLEVDYEWYLEHQILPPISRLCSVIAGTSQGNLAQAMGLNASKYVMFEREAREFQSNRFLHVVTRISLLTLKSRQSLSYLAQENHANFHSKITKNITRASRSNTGTFNAPQQWTLMMTIGHLHPSH